MASIHYSDMLQLLTVFFISATVFLHRRKRLPITNWPFLGMTPDVILNANRLHDFATRLLKLTDGNTFIVKGPWFANIDMLLTADPANIHYMLSKNFTNYPKGPQFRTIFDILGDGIFNSDHELWEIHRKTTMSVLKHPEFPTLLETTIKKKVEHGLLPVLDSVSCGHQETDLQEIFQRLTFDVICVLVLDCDPESLSTELPFVPCEKAFTDAEEALLWRHVLPERVWKLQKRLGMGKEKKMSEASKAFDEFIYKSFDEFEKVNPFFEKVKMSSEKVKQPLEKFEKAKQPFKKSEKVKQPFEKAEKFKQPFGKAEKFKQPFEKSENVKQLFSLTANDPSDPLQNEDQKFRLLTLLTRGFEQRMTPENTRKFIKDAVLNLMLAGRDTTSTALSWFFYLLTQNPAVETNIRDEIEQRFGGRNYESLGLKEVGELVYLHGGICEALRLYPPVAFEHKSPTKADVLPTGHAVDEHTRIILSFYSMGRMEGIWGEDWMEFKPERWVSGGGTTRHEPSYKFPAFHAGPRTCLGKEMGLMQVKMVAIAVIRRYHVELVEGHDVCASDSIILQMKYGLKIKLFPVKIDKD